MRGRLLPVLAACCWLGLPGSAAAAQGTVIWKNQDCAYFILQTATGYGLFEWVSGAAPNDGDVIEGDLDAPGTLHIHNRTADVPVTAFAAAQSAQRSEVEKKIPASCR